MAWLHVHRPFEHVVLKAVWLAQVPYVQVMVPLHGCPRFGSVAGQPVGGPKQCQMGGSEHTFVQFAAHKQ